MLYSFLPVPFLLISRDKKILVKLARRVIEITIILKEMTSNTCMVLDKLPEPDEDFLESFQRARPSSPDMDILMEN
jgi:hypothetical protein